ncbi:hypothetical protein PHYPSEUDO_009190 [Phytophthora pseudosyringae]|uniref:Uncharacterized protein n=1 Tax=Phytophthora pseudosyringae TaxID=221518 RepID=A0A8T1W7J5_9STRA|nr:hypothetical protein PHYPSEUDO_009190 [Phytophthora pseudosyringae]
MAAPRKPPPPPGLCQRNALWWNRTYGRGDQPEGAAQSSEPSALGSFYRAIRDNQVEQVRRYIVGHPAAVFTKRTALYVASFFGRHKVVEVLLRRGADKDLQCDGARPIDVAGFASADPVDRMKVLSLLQGDACPQVILRLDDRNSAGFSGGAASETRRVRLEIHFSEPVGEFTQEDVAVSDGCEVTRFSMLRADLYLATVQLAKGSRAASVHVPAGAARAAGSGRCSAQSRPLQLA